jgi:hypothetical protein
MLQTIKSAQERWNDRVGAPRLPLTSSVFPQDALAIIYKPTRSAMTSGTARSRQWKLRFARRSAPFIEPLMGWTGGDDPLVHVELSFPSAAAAVAYARRQGLNFELQGKDIPSADLREIAKPAPARSIPHQPHARPWHLEWVERTLGPEIIRNGFPPGTDPSMRYAGPADVLADPTLSEAVKREFLERWALEAYLIELELAEGNAVPFPSRLDEVIDALVHLEGDHVRTCETPPPPRRVAQQMY